MPMACRSRRCEPGNPTGMHQDEQTVGRVVSSGSPQNPQLRIFTALGKPLSWRKAPVFPNDVTPYKATRTEFLGSTGASEGEIRQWVGHADSKMVEHYRHLGQKDALRRMEQISFVDLDAKEQERPGRQEEPAQNLDPGVCDETGQ
jgi:hypothetical protein